MNRLRLGDALHRAPKAGSGLSSIWAVVIAIVLTQILNDCFGWLEDDNIRLIGGFFGGVVLMIIWRAIRGSRY
jgi:hypothetical protein